MHGGGAPEDRLQQHHFLLQAIHADGLQLDLLLDFTEEKEWWFLSCNSSVLLRESFPRHSSRI